jgi:transportin-1
MEFIMYCMTLPTESVAMAACDFWPCVVEIDQGVNLTIDFAPRLIPIVFDCLKYSEFELSLIRKDLEGTASAENIDPSMYMAHARVEGDDDDDEDDEAAEHFLSGKNWNVRKCAAASLDVICGYCGSPIYHVTMHEISTRLMNGDWLVREAALLGLGAIADGAMEDIAKDLPTIFPTILEYVSDPQPAISVIACWVLSQYATWAADESDRQTFFEPMLRVLIELTVSPNKLIQDAACSALGSVQESVRAGMGPYVDVLLEAYLGVFGRYKKRNMVVLLDSISTLAESSTSHFSQSPHLPGLCNSLQHLWETIKVTQNIEAESTRIIDILYCPLLECWASVCRSAGQNLPPASAEFVFNRSLCDWREGIQVCSSLVESGGEMDDIEEVKDVVVCCIDLVSAVVHAMGAGLEEIVARSNLIDLLTYTFDDISHEVRQNVYALCGDIAKNIFGRLLPYLDHIVTKLVEGLDMGSQSMCNNASWALGEIIMVAGEGIATHAQVMLQAFITCLEVDDIRPSLHHNLCVSIGRLSSACPEVVAPFITRFFVTWCQSMKGFKQQPEKYHAFQGIIRCVHIVGLENLMEDFPYFVESCSMYRSPSDDIRDAILELVHAYKGMAGDYWNQMMMEFTPQVKDNLRVRFGIV